MSAFRPIWHRKNLKFEGAAGVFDCEEDAFAAVIGDRIKEGDVIVIRYEGPKGGSGMREMLSTTAALYGRGMGENVAGAGRIVRGRHAGCGSDLDENGFRQQVKWNALIRFELLDLTS